MTLTEEEIRILLDLYGLTGPDAEERAGELLERAQREAAETVAAETFLKQATVFVDAQDAVGLRAFILKSSR